MGIPVFYRCLLLWLVLLVALPQTSWAQACNPTNPQLPLPFRVFDVQTGREVTALCVGRQVRLEPNHPFNPNQLFYEVNPGRNALPNPCTFANRSLTYTPTQAGPITIAENARAPGGPGGLATVYFRNFEVYAHPEPAFTLTGCAPGFVLVTVTEAAYDRFEIRIGNTALTPAPTRNVPQRYALPTGATTVKVTGHYTATDLCSDDRTQTITTLAAPQPVTLTSLTRQGSSAEFSFGALQAGYTYTLGRVDATAPGGFRAAGVIPNGNTTFTLANAPLGCYLLRRTDPCLNPASSSQLCTIQLTAAPGVQQNILTWATDGTFSTYEVRRDGTLLTTLPGATARYEDAAVTCGVTYTYQITGRRTGQTSVSNAEDLRTTFTTTPVTPVLSGTFNPRNQLDFTVTVPGTPTGGQIVLRREQDSTTQRLGPYLTRTPRDSTLLVSFLTPACYTAQYLDPCGNPSNFSRPFCPVMLDAVLPDPNGDAAALQWTALQGPDPTQPVTYRVQLLDATGTVINTRPVGGTSFLDTDPPSERQVLRYRIQATGGGLPAPSYSNWVSVARRLQLFVPTAFTPNGNRLNDVLFLKGRYLGQFTFVIVDRNGQQVFRTTDRTQSWNGRIGNEPPVPGTYVWRFEAQQETGQPFVQHGAVTILK